MVTHDRFLAHVEPDVAVNPRDRNNLLGASQFVARRTPLPGAFASFDGGRHWSDRGVLPLPHGFELGADTTVAFDEQGNGFVSALMWHGGGGYASRVTRGGIFLWRTIDGGRNFSEARPVYVGTGFQDHPWLGVRSTHKRSELFVTWANSAGLEFARSVDDGRTFARPRTVVAGSAPSNPVLAVGGGRSLRIFFQSFAGRSIRLFLVESRDDGSHFGRPTLIGTVAGIRTGGGPKGGDAPPPLLSASIDLTTGTTAVAIATLDAEIGHPVIEIWEQRPHRSWLGPLRPIDKPVDGLTELQPRLAFSGRQLYVSFFSVTRQGDVRAELAHAKIGAARFSIRALSDHSFRYSGFLGDYQGLAMSRASGHALWNAASSGRLEIEASSFDVN